MLGTTGFPTAPLSVNTFFVKQQHILVTCTGYDDDTTPSTVRTFTGCNLPTAIGTGADLFETAYLADAGLNTIGG